MMKCKPGYETQLRRMARLTRIGQREARIKIADRRGPNSAMTTAPCILLLRDNPMADAQALSDVIECFIIG
jgi:hypothetical protein